MNLRSLAVLSIPLAIAVAGCDPCAGTISCSTGSKVTLSGGIVDHTTGNAVPGARIAGQFLLSNGHTVTAATTTGGDGLWELSVPAPDGDQVQATITVTSPNQPSYTVPAFPVHPSTSSGDATLLGQWTDVPFIRFLATVVRVVDGVPMPVPGAHVTFAPTSGATLRLAQTEADTDGGGTFQMDFEAEQLLPTVGVLTITHPSLATPTVYASYSIPLDYHFVIPSVRTLVEVGQR